MGDDIGWMQVGAYHRGLSLGETPNIDRIGKEGAIFMQYYAMQSCTSGRNASLPCCPPSTLPWWANRGGKVWGVNEAGMKQLDDNIGLVSQKLEQVGQLDNTIVVFTTDIGAEAISFPDGGVTPFKGPKG